MKRKTISRFLLIFITLLLIVIISYELKGEKQEQEKREDLYFELEAETDLREKIGQMLIIGFRGTEIEDDSYITKAINDLNLGGVILFDRDVPSNGKVERNILNPNQTKKLIDDLKKESSLFIAVDAEGGYVNRLKENYGFINIPSAQSMGRKTPIETGNYANLLGNQLKNLGFNLNFAPVVDVNVNPKNPIIGYLERSFSEDPKEVINHASSFIKGLNSNGIITAIKHFPGHGSSDKDSHLGMVDITKTYKEEEILPYQELILNGYDGMIMTAHVINTEIDQNYPATLSSFFLQDVLRNDFGFEGVIVSDDIQMRAIVDNYGYQEAVIKSINAGCDILIISNNISIYDEEKPYETMEIILKAVERGEITEERINQSYKRIQSLKERYLIK